MDNKISVASQTSSAGFSPLSEVEKLRLSQRFQYASLDTPSKTVSKHIFERICKNLNEVFKAQDAPKKWLALGSLLPLGAPAAIEASAFVEGLFNEMLLREAAIEDLL